MKEVRYDAVVIGGGAAGMAAALEIDKNGFSVAILEREEKIGGILIQCIHNGFGLHEFKEELTGPEYAERFEKRVSDSGVQVYVKTTVMEINNTDAKSDFACKELYCYSALYGILKITTPVVVLAMGCRERNRGNIRIPGTRPSGIFTAGLAQRLVNIEGFIPGKDVVIAGSGDVGLIMARRMQWIGCTVHGVVEILPYPSGLTRNIVQCLNDFSIPLYLSHIISRIYGKERIEKVEVTPIIDGLEDPARSFEVKCDTLLLSVGLIPENELSKQIGIAINPQTNGPWVDSRMMTSVPGIFACGNVLHVHDLVDFVTEESRLTGGFVTDYLKNQKPALQIRIKAGANVRYVNPGKLDPERNNKLYFRAMIVKNNAAVEVKLDNIPVKKVRKSHV
ncbi:MAG: FAD-dependent oxidoreductase, partial [Spirochaetota bacterium]